MRTYLFRLWLAGAAIAGFLAVASAALAAHVGLEPGALALLRSAVEMGMWHALALFGVGLWARSGGGAIVHAAGGLFLGGIILFCGALGALALLQTRLPSAAPAGGLLLMAGWLVLIVAGLRAR